MFPVRDRDIYVFRGIASGGLKTATGRLKISSVLINIRCGNGPLAPARHELHARPRVPGRTGGFAGKSTVHYGKDVRLTSAVLIRPSLNEIRRLLARTFIAASNGIDHLLHWAGLRLRHQTRAMISHYNVATTYLKICDCSTRVIHIVKHG